MCDNCKTIDDQILRYRRIKDRINDRQTQQAMQSEFATHRKGVR